MRCAYCTRRAVHEFENAPSLCASCGEAYRSGFERGRMYESISRRERGRTRKASSHTSGSSLVDAALKESPRGRTDGDE